jgi:DNA-binding winged helix-turn-helix (wHTH) protein/tetratricopeptide (TPR) repeat protein
MTHVTTRWTHRFGPFDFDVRSGELRRSDRTICLSPHLAAVLEALLDHPGELVTRETLRQRVWPEHTFVDFEHGLTVAIARLREALGDSAAHPEFVETIPRRGYRWIHPLDAPESHSLTVDAPPVDAPALPPPGGAPHGVPSGPRPTAPLSSVLRSSGVGARRGGFIGMLAIAVVILLWVALGPRWSREAPVAGIPAAGGVAPEVPPEVTELYARGRLSRVTGSAAEWRQAVAYLTKAVELTPSFALARALLAQDYAIGAYYGYVPTRAVASLARAHATEALRLDPELAAAHVASGDARFFFDWDWAGAERAYRTAASRAPDDDGLLRSYARLLAKGARFEEAIALHRRSLERDPLDPGRTAALAATLLDARRFDEALDVMNRLDEVTERSRARVRVVTAAAYAGKRDCENATRDAERALTALAEAQDDITLGAAGWVYATCGRPEQARAALARLETPVREGDEITRAAIYGALGDTERGLALVERGVENRSAVAVVLGVDFMLDALRGEPGFQRAVARVRGTTVAPGQPAR